MLRPCRLFGIKGVSEGPGICFMETNRIRFQRVAVIFMPLIVENKLSDVYCLLVNHFGYNPEKFNL